MGYSVDDILDMEDKNWKEHTPNTGGDIPEGVYHARINKVVMKVSKKGKLMLSFDMIIVGDRFNNKHLFVNGSLEGAGLPYTKDKVFACGLKPESLKDLKKMVMQDAFNGILMEVKVSYKDDNQNVFFKKRIQEEGTSQDVPEDAEEDEDDLPF